MTEFLIQTNHAVTIERDWNNNKINLVTIKCNEDEFIGNVISNHMSDKSLLKLVKKLVGCLLTKDKISLTKELIIQYADNKDDKFLKNIVNQIKNHYNI